MEIAINYHVQNEKLSHIEIEALGVFTLTYVKAPHECEVSLSFVSSEEIARLNEAYRGYACPTDVLSFECDATNDEFMLNDTDTFEEPVITLGDVIIAPDVAATQCTEYGTTFEQEISLLLVHGLLHLCGYDHTKEEDALEMEALEKEILSAWYKEEVRFR